jgi:hypothetical protein
MPERVQLSRRKGWRMPPNTVSVARPGPFSNPFVVRPDLKPGTALPRMRTSVRTPAAAVRAFRDYVPQRPALVLRAKRELRGRNLACWCGLEDDCHADVWLEIVND